MLTADDGYKLWINYVKVDNETLRKSYEKQISSVVWQTESPVILAAVKELKTAFSALTGRDIAGAPAAGAAVESAGAVVLAYGNDKAVSNLKAAGALAELGRDGYMIRSNAGKTYILGNTDKGVLYGVFNLVRLMQTHGDIANLDIRQKPAYDVRILNHWDNLDRSVERGYAGASIWEWEKLPDTVSPRYEDYARANASIGINAAALNNVNANAAFITPGHLQKVKALADIFRPYGIRVYLSINFSSPKILGNLETSDPLDPAVQKWWADKAAEIYKLIPDFGGFLVKANSEGQPGPQDYGRTHADGANMLAAALKPYGGIVMWRAFVYTVDANDPAYDRAKQAYLEFKPFDGKFADNVVIQVKNGPIDFQPREPVTSLFGAMKETPLMIEFQITQEYLGHSIQLVYLAPMWKEVLDQDTYCEGAGSTVAHATDGTIFRQTITAVAGVSNVGTDPNWNGHIFAQSNWYAFGRLAWNPGLTSEQIADEWLRMTFTNDDAFVKPVKQLMLDSHEAAVKYMQPLGLHHIFAGGHHYGPGVWERIVPGVRPDWVPEYYHRANKDGVGFDRTAKGSDYVSQYHSPLREYYNDLETCPDNMLLFFHHLPWDYKMRSGRALWEEMSHVYTEGLDDVRRFQKIWDRQEGRIDAERFKAVQYKLREQLRDAIWWRDGVLLYFQSINGLPIPHELERPMNKLEDLLRYRLNLGHTSLPPGAEAPPRQVSPMTPGPQ
uniref:Xylan alpha-1,2-glucuronidase n=1 Tax=uncultured bacterium contig00036 TaxID=1181524 RepID=A0A806KEJ8_9BACT|nr:alpha-glucuronidase [uncultured bacterium contig00036]